MINNILFLAYEIWFYLLLIASIKILLLLLFSLFKFTLVLNSVRLFWKLLAFVSLLGTSETFLCSTFALQLKTVLLLDVLQLLMLSAGTLMSLEIIMFPWNTFYCEQDTVCMLSIYLIVCVQKSILFYFIFSRSIILCTFVDI
jgi:hypothetical protein